MLLYNIKDFKGGWFIGNFEPSILYQPNFEVCVTNHPKDSYWAPHYHKITTEYNLLLKGRMEICGCIVREGDIFVIPPGETASPIFLEDCQVLIIKTPSDPQDKYLV